MLRKIKTKTPITYERLKFAKNYKHFRTCLRKINVVDIHGGPFIIWYDFLTTRQFDCRF